MTAHSKIVLAGSVPDKVGLRQASVLCVSVSGGPEAVTSSENQTAQHVSLEMVVSPSQAGSGGGDAHCYPRPLCTLLTSYTHPWIMYMTPQD